MPNRTCTIHGQYDEIYAICPKCAGAASDGPTIGPTGAGVPTDLETLPPRGNRSGQGTAGTSTIPPRSGGSSGVGTIVEGLQETGLLGWLIVKEAPSMRRGHVLTLKPNVLYGRGTSAGFTVPDDKMSEIHARIQRVEASWKITDTGSTNGTHVNGKKIKETTALQENDEIKMGSSVFILKILD